MQMQSKKLLLLDILHILQKYTDAQHKLTQKEIQELLYSEYGMEAGTKAIKNNLSCLVEFGYELYYDEIERRSVGKDGSEISNTIMTNIYLERDITDSELLLLIDSILFSDSISPKQGDRLIEKLSALSSKYFSSHVRHISRVSDSAKDANPQLFLNIEVLDEAIETGRQVTFHYLEYRTDKKLHHRRDENGKIREYRINPYHLAAKDGKYYLICNNDKYDILSNYRVDRIADIRLTDDRRKPFCQLKEARSGSRTLNLKEYMEKHIYMFAGESVRVKFRIEKFLLGDVFDRFGSRVAFEDETEDSVTVTVNVNETAMEHFVKKSLPHITVLSPQSLRDKLAAELEEALQTFRNEPPQ